MWVYNQDSKIIFLLISLASLALSKTMSFLIFAESKIAFEKIAIIILRWVLVLKLIILPTSSLGAIFILRKDVGLGGWFRKWQFSLTLCSKNVLT